MVSAAGIIGVVVCVSLLEGMWAWLLAAAVAEVAGQGHPAVPALGLVLLAAWVAARVTALLDLPLDRRRWLLVGGGVVLAATFGTIQAGLVLPVQLVFGHYTPDYRGAGIVLLLLTAYLWGRGLALATRVSRERVIGHITIAASALAAVLIFLPLTDAVQRLGLSTVVVAFLLAVAGLLLTQLESAASRRLTPLQWASVGAGASIAVVLCSLLLTGVFASGALAQVLQPVWGAARLASPVADALLLAAGYLAQYLTFLFRWLAEVFGADPEAINRAMQQAQGERPSFDPDVQPASPEILTIFVAVVLTILFVLVAVAIFYRLVARIWNTDDQEVQETRLRAQETGPGLLRGMLDRLFHGRGDGPVPDDPRAAIRHHYRAFQLLMARAGRPRGSSQTPREYQHALAEDLPTADPPVREITDAYVVARYGAPTAPVPDPERVRQAVASVRDALRAQD